MLCIFSNSTNPYFNIATEEHLLKNFNDDVFFLYSNEPSVIVGKHQNTLAEVDYQYTKKNDIKVIRRLSGGGAVFHDLGNVNFTFIRNGKEGKLVDFRGFTKPVIGLLHELGIEAKFEGYNSLTINGKKFSGNAEHVFKNRVMHHGTMLFSTNLKTLAQVLYVNKNRYSHKGIQSVRATVTNISEHLAKEMPIDAFKAFVHKFILREFNGTNHLFSTEDVTTIKQLVNEKYATWEWNFGYSPSYSFKRETKNSKGKIQITAHVEKGVMVNLTIQGDGLTQEEKNQVSDVLSGKTHNPLTIKRIVEETTLSSTDKNIVIENLL
ncbi:MAG: lipoate--protein ligase [Bacteroidales bacterium]